MGTVPFTAALRWRIPSARSPHSNAGGLIPRLGDHGGPDGGRPLGPYLEGPPQVGNPERLLAWPEGQPSP